VWIVGGTQAALNGTDGIATARQMSSLPSAGQRRSAFPQRTAKKRRAKMRDIVVRSLPRTSAKITFEDRYPAMTPNDGNYQLLKQLDQVSQDLGAGKMEALDPAERGAGDIAFCVTLNSGAWTVWR